MNKILSVPDTRQSNESDCGVSVTQAILAYYGEDYSESELSDKLQPYTLEDGVPRKNIIKLFKEFGYKVWSGKMEIEHLIKCIDRGYPVIILIQAWSEDKNVNWEKTVDWGHYIIIKGYDEKKIFIEDPALFGSGELSYDELETRWHGLDEEYLQNFGMIIFGNPNSPVNKIYHVDEGGTKVIKDDSGESHINEKEVAGPVIKKIYQKLGEVFNKKLLKGNELDDEPDLLKEAMTGPKFYDLVSSRGFKKDELFSITLPIELLDTKKFKNAYSISIETEIPIDTDKIKEYISKFDEALATNTELYAKYKKMAYWYNDFNELLFKNLGESDALLFLVAAAFCSANTALDVNIIEASKLFTAVKIDFHRGNVGKSLLRYLAANIQNIDKQENIKKLAKIGQANSSYLKLLSPKTDPTYKDVFREITVSGAKLKNFNDFIIYYLDHNGKLTKDELVNDIKSGKLPVGGTKIYSFLLNLVDPDFEWKSVATDDYNGGKIKPATIDRWMIRVFFDKTLNNAIKELVDNKIIEGSQKSIDKFKNTVIMQLFGSDITRANVIKLMNEILDEYTKSHPETELKYAHQLQAFGWVLIRDEYKIPSADFASFEDVMNFTKKTSDMIDKINPQLNFINGTGDKVRNKVVSVIKLLGNIPRFKLKSSNETEESIKNWLNFYSTFEKQQKKEKAVSNSGEASAKFLITKPIKTNDIYQSDIKQGKKVLQKITGNNPNAVFLSAKSWIRNHQQPIEIPPKIKMVKNKKSKTDIKKIVAETNEFLLNYFNN